MTAPIERVLRRILVALDASDPSREALSTAASLAARIGARLEGFYVEDENLLRAADLPFAAELSFPTGVLRRVDRSTMEAQLRAVAEEARAALAAAAGTQRVAWSFRVARGVVPVELLAAAVSVDLLVVGRRTQRGRAGPGRTARAAASRAPTSVLVAGRTAAADGRVVLAYDGSPAAGRALEHVRDLALAGPSAPTLLVLASDARDVDRIAHEARRHLGPEPVAVRWAGGDRLDDLVRAVAHSGALLVLGAEAPVLGGGGLERLLDAVDGPVLLIR